MFKRSLLFFLLIFSLSTYAQTEAQLQEMYVSHLKELGYQPSVDSDGDIRFKEQGIMFYIDVDADDLQSFRIVLANFWKIESPEEKEKAYEAANFVNSKMKVVKTYLNPDQNSMWMDANIYIEKPEAFKSSFRRMVNVLILGIKSFHEKMKGSAGAV